MDKKESARLSQVLETALVVFSRQGYRKTSIEDIAKAAGISRQGLYLHFKNKDEIFSASIQKSLDDGLQAANSILEDRSLTLEEKLLNVLDEWFGRHVGLLQPEASDLAVHCERLLGDLVGRKGSIFQQKLIKAIREASAEQTAESEQHALTVAEVLCACALTWKHTLDSRREFLDKLRGTIQLCCRNL